MNRRQYLGVVAGVGSLAGCSEATSLGTPTSEPTLYEQSDEDDMVLGLDAFPEGWTTADPDEVDDGIDVIYTNGEGSAGVWMGVEVFETIDGARERYEGAKERTDSNDYSLADAAAWGERSDSAYVLFRHSNAFGQCWGRRQSGTKYVPDVTRAQDYAGEILNHWKSL